ncbi:uncharacterized protein LOC100122847 isoform X1 [Nasonia vitripennis]|uniref:Uncharacterized protein n=1 Tax=Nasonia vitripennis TaxID=7425 RepID=A0A7M7GBF3_NASVI|nr:uncharacterized protein LOC100122847 isoform X1 [Nasonia vitripennis]
MRFSRQRTLSLRSGASYSGMFLHKILAAILLLQVVRAFYIPMDTAESVNSTADDSSSSESTFEITEAALPSDSNEMTDTTNVQDLILDQVLIPLMDIKRVQNLLFLISMNAAKRVTYLLMKYSIRIIFMFLAMMFPRTSLLSLAT